jgi:hypothetical protein
LSFCSLELLELRLTLRIFRSLRTPISEGGKWINGGVVGLDWNNVATTTGFAYGTDPGQVAYADSWALLTSTWGQDQTVQATIKDHSPNTKCHQEHELVLRGSLAAHVATGYEVTVRATNDSSSYLLIARWNGAIGNFTYLTFLSGSAYGVKTGDVFKATIVGNVITAYINGVQKARVTDNTYATGQPGMGFYLDNPASCSGTNTNYGYANYTAVAASSGTTTTPAPAVTAISPASGPSGGGTAITITGTGFSLGATVQLGGTAASSVNVVNSTTITAVTPAHVTGAVNVVVTNTDGQSGALPGGYTYTSQTGISFVQGNSGPSTLQSSNISVSVAFPQAQIGGDLNVVAIGWGDTTSAISSVTDDQGNTYLRAVGPTKTTGLQQVIYYARNIVSGSNRVTVTFNQAASYPDVRILEYSGVDANSPLDVTSAAVGTGTTANSGFATTTSATELIFASGTTGSTFTGAGSGFINRGINVFGNIAEDKFVSATGAYNATATTNYSNWVMQMATFRSAVSLNAPVAPAPTVTAVSPNSGPSGGGTGITITGTGFSSGATVQLGGTAATAVKVINSTTVSSVTPAHVAGTVSVVVTNTDGQSGTLSGGYTYTSAKSISFVQANFAPGTLQAWNSSVTVSYPQVQQAGDLNIVAVGWGDTTSAVSSVTDSQGNVYVPAIGPTKTAGLQQVIYYARNIVGGSNQVIVTFSQAASYPDVRILEYSGIDTNSPLDVTAAGVGAGTAANSGFATTTSPTELIFATGTTGTAFSAAGSGFTNRGINVYGNIAEDRTVTSTGAYNATATTSSSNWIMQMATFKAAF